MMIGSVFVREVQGADIRNTRWLTCRLAYYGFVSGWMNRKEWVVGSPFVPGAGEGSRPGVSVTRTTCEDSGGLRQPLEVSTSW